MLYFVLHTSFQEVEQTLALLLPVCSLLLLLLLFLSFLLLKKWQSKKQTISFFISGGKNTAKSMLYSSIKAWLKN